MIDLKDAEHDISRELEAPSLSVQAVPHTCRITILYLAIVDIYSVVRVNLCSCIHLRDDKLGLETCILGEGARDNFERLAEAFASILVEAGLLLGELRDVLSEEDLGSTTTGNHSAVTHKCLNGVDTIINGAFSILEERICRATEDNGSHLVFVPVAAEDSAPL